MNIDLKKQLEIFLSRAKKLWLILIIPPILFGSLLYSSSTIAVKNYTASAKIGLGNFESGGLTNLNYLRSYIQSNDYLEQIFNDKEIDEMANSLLVQILNGEIVITYSGVDKKFVKGIVDRVSEGIIKQSTDKIEENQKRINDAISNVEKLKPQSKNLVNIEIAINDFKREKSSLVNNFVTQKTIISESEKTSTTLNTLLGLLAGVLVDLILIFSPEILGITKKID